MAELARRPGGLIKRTPAGRNWMLIRGLNGRCVRGVAVERGVAAVTYVKAPMPVMARPTMSVCMVSVPSKVWIASMSTMCRMTW